MPRDRVEITHDLIRYDDLYVTQSILSPSSGSTTSVMGMGGEGNFLPDMYASIEKKIMSRKADNAAMRDHIHQLHLERSERYEPTELRMLSHRTSSMNVRSSPSVTRDLFNSSCKEYEPKFDQTRQYCLPHYECPSV